MLRIVVTEGSGMDLADKLIDAIRAVVDHLEAFPPQYAPPGSSFADT